MGSRVNLGCGPIYVDDPAWINLDFSPASNSVKQANLLKGLIIDSSSCDLVYSSHFLEHIPRAKVAGFLGECFRILRPGGILRLVLPDLEEMCREYLHQRVAGNHEHADLVVVEIVDQCVRMECGGELGRLYKKYRLEPDRYLDMKKYLRERNGEALELPSLSAPSINPQKSHVFRALRSHSKRLEKVWKRKWFNWLIAQLPSDFVEQNLSFASVGEKHHWLWDFHQLATELEASGFIGCIKLDCHNSRFNDFPFFPLDVDVEGLPRKGRESMFVEAVKPF